ncbi:MAG: NADH-quinone oxidoreductase subunit L [Pelagibacteraceae bacterium TMED247]|nr:NADH-quinone oxidoreductase subunit L [Candidatus Pelagibacter sp.]RPG05810.1 MAG: NADH-quinone oxidoreductase subunit L [Pelagibacteraceae bacterium TMED247]|tara:strand:+ start:4801 stop:6708 length:1908 start_codon:yes stop_codon:yes gene_type:complete
MEYAILFLPLIGAIVGYFFKYIGDIYSQLITTIFVSISAVLSIIVFYNGVFYGEYGNYAIYEWIASGEFIVGWSINIDPLSSIMLVVVSLVSALVHIYSIGYMSHDPHKPRFMSYLSLFTFSMLVLVVSDNFLQLYFGWEGVGLCSYLLIGFWYKKESANNAAIKAFIVNRVGDFGFGIGIFIIFMYFGTLNYNEVFAAVPSLSNAEINFLGFNSNLITLICIFLFIGAMGKSAQFFLHTWLPDAMEGPTPVSALIHAATMVTAGVFLVVRCSPIFEYSQVALNFVAIIGMITAFFAASVAVVQNDIKRIIAYSTCSQLGYMFFATGVGAYHVAIFHLFTHAFFKALLFLGSGSVIHSLKDEQDIRNMGGIWKKMPLTWISMIIGTLALTGFPFLSGYYSKDAIIEFAYLKGTNIGYFAAGIGIITAVLTAIYSWRLIFKTFHGNFNNKSLSKIEVNESGMIIICPLALLVLGAVFSGFLFKDFLIGHHYEDFWKNSILIIQNIDHSNVPIWILFTTPFLVTISIPIAYYLYIKNNNLLENIKLKNRPIYNFLLNKWYFDEIYDFILVKPTKFIGSFFWKSGDIKTIDRYGPDGVSKIVKSISNKSSKFQSGYIYDYAFVMLIGLSLLLTFFIFY